ncbi:MAG: hypothetical protein FWG11_03110 [Promicromonosporaceae bacterium]|nr:hypothetical protein [Promicromonosporaceae bacterium]
MTAATETLTATDTGAEPGTEHALTVTDRCDRCGAQAWVRVELASGELLFCGHHGRAYAGAYTPKARLIQDETSRMVQEFAPAR